MGSPLAQTLARAFLCFYGLVVKKWLEQCLDEFKPGYYK